MEENIDVHIVAMLVGDEAERRAAWELEQRRRLVAQWREHEADVAARRVFEEQAARVRDECAARLAAQVEWLEPYVDGTMGEVSAGMAAAYTRAVGQLAGLYGLGRPRRPVTGLPVVPEPPVPVAVAGVEEERVAVVAAAAELRAVVVAELAGVRGRMLQLEAGGE